MRHYSRRTCLLALAAAIFAAPAAASAATIGFNQVSGTWDYNTASNWVSNDIDGLWDTSLTLTGAETATFAADTALTTGLTFNYTGNFALTLDSSSATGHTITLGGDIAVAPASNQTITIGSDTDALNVDLGGATRTFTVAASKILSFRNALTDGDFNVTGGGTVKLGGANGNAASSNINVNLATLNFDSSTGGVSGTTRASSVTLTNGNLTLNGNSTANSVDSVTGAVTIDGSTGGVDYISLSPNGSRNAELSAGSLVRTNHGVAVLTGTNLGVNSIASQTAGAANISLSTTPTLIGGGGALGTTTMSIIPWAIGSTTVATGSGGASSFVTYDATNGIHPLTAAEYATSITDGTVGTDNVSLNNASGSYGTIASGATINSLFLTNTNSGTTSTLDGTGTLTITSGALYLSSSKGVVINCNINFGANEGIIGFTSGKTSTINGNIAGSGGLTLYQPLQSAFGTGITLGGGASTYTGDTYILGNVTVSSNVLPNGVRTGDVYVVSGTLSLNTSFAASINGLNGNGTVYYGHSTTASISVGDNNSNGTFGGTINDAADKKLSLSKIGSGTQTLSGTNAWYGTTTITGGTLALSGAGSINTSSGITVNGTGAAFITNSSVAVTAPVTVAKGTIGGTGAIGVPVTVGSNAILSPGNSPGAQAYTAGLTWADGGSYVWQINDATGAAGTNYDQVDVTGGLTVTATTTPFTIAITGLNAGDNVGVVPNFDNASNYTWVIAATDGVTGFSPADFTLDTTNFAGSNPLGGGSFSIQQVGNDVDLVFTPSAVPEPASLALLAIGGLALVRRRRR